jgi:hypothetical protein
LGTITAGLHENTNNKIIHDHYIMLSWFIFVEDIVIDAIIKWTKLNEYAD